jgi:hypothetical protein
MPRPILGPFRRAHRRRRSAEARCGAGALATRFGEPEIWGCTRPFRHPDRPTRNRCRTEWLGHTHRESTRWGRSLDTGHNRMPWNQPGGNRWPSAPRPGMAPAPAGVEVPRTVCLPAWLVKGRPSPGSRFASRPLQTRVKWEESPRKGSPSPPGGRWTVRLPTRHAIVGVRLVASDARRPRTCSPPGAPCSLSKTPPSPLVSYSRPPRGVGRFRRTHLSQPIRRVTAVTDSDAALA